VLGAGTIYAVVTLDILPPQPILFDEQRLKAFAVFNRNGIRSDEYDSSTT
jgi:hypothetical protein